jgi:hypothetical protein
MANSVVGFCRTANSLFFPSPFDPQPSFLGLVIDDMGIGGQAKQLLNQGMKNKPNTNTHEANQTQTPLKAKEHGCQILWVLPNM